MRSLQIRLTAFVLVEGKQVLPVLVPAALILVLASLSSATGKSSAVAYSIPKEQRLDHIPSTQQYPVEEVMLDLLHTAAISLVWCVSSFVLFGLLTFI